MDFIIISLELRFHWNWISIIRDYKEIEIMDETHTDPMEKDKKYLPLSKLSQVIPTFLITLLILLPLYIAVLLPLTIISLVFKAIFSFGKRPSIQNNGKVTVTNAGAVAYVATEQRPLDIVVFGATGFTGEHFPIHCAHLIFMFIFLVLIRQNCCQVFGQTIWNNREMGHCWSPSRSAG